MALETVNSPKVKAVADKLSTMAMENGAYWYEYQGQNADLDTTGWAMEALSVVGRSTYDAAISKAYTFVQSKLNSTDGYFDNWGGNADTQSCVLEGLSVAGYTLDTNAYNYLLSYQNEDGTFNALNYSTGQLEPNAYASVEGARALGVINHESFVLKARQDYTNTTTPVVTEPEKPTTPTTPTTPNTTTPAVKPETTTTTEPKKETVKAVNTGDNTNVMAYVVAAIAAVGVIVLVIKSKKK